MPFGLQPIHLVAIFVVALLIFGPRRLPEIGRGIGKAINEFRKGTQEMTESLRDEVSRPNRDTQTGTVPGPSMAPSAYAETMPASAAPVAAAPVVTATGNFCTNCGSPNPAEARFCNKCGTQLSA